MKDKIDMVNFPLYLFFTHRVTLSHPMSANDEYE